MFKLILLLIIYGKMTVCVIRMLIILLFMSEFFLAEMCVFRGSSDGDVKLSVAKYETEIRLLGILSCVQDHICNVCYLHLLLLILHNERI